ncbi:NUMOD4 motif-containing HNH endonuclease [Microbacterium sp. LWH12-1.2]|uniref:NUMOD4 motif-containing HNH endonuclease n=1 Tax=Microbacterium sp. LWH12-1.2 TaxID=3135259 RepID=UPI0034408B44
MTEEVWRPVFGYEGSYEVSSAGRVRSIPRSVTRSDGRVFTYRGQVLSLKFQHHYWRVGLSMNGETISWCVHRLVCEAFHGQKPSGHVVRHLNGVSTDNESFNLAWGTPAENSADMVAHGNSRASQTHCKRGHEFTPENTHVSRANRRVCRACDRIHNKAEAGHRSARRKANRPTITCRVCGSQFQSSAGGFFCSPECKKASRRVEFLNRESNHARVHG